MTKTGAEKLEALKKEAGKETLLANAKAIQTGKKLPKKPTKSKITES